MAAAEGSGGRKWRPIGRRELLDCGIFKVVELENEAHDGRRGRFTVLEAPDWATVVPLVERGGKGYFLMVRQYRHGSGEACVEFPGGVVEAGEEPIAAAERELEEETGWRAARIRHAGTTFPNPAFMSNRVHVFFAEGLDQTGRKELDEHEIVDHFLVPVEEVREKMGFGEYSHALMVAALRMAEALLPG
jgi:ADP-ribose pyrophosphatase